MTKRRKIIGREIVLLIISEYPALAVLLAQCHVNRSVSFSECERASNAPQGERRKRSGKDAAGEKKNQQVMRVQSSFGRQSIGAPRQSNLKWQQSRNALLSLSRPR